jgi:RNA-directed DNA polymerase
MAGTTIDRKKWRRVLDALKLTYEQLNAEGLTAWNQQLQEAIYQCQYGLEVEGLEQIRPIMKTVVGYDPLAPDESRTGEQEGRGGAPAHTPPSLQDLRRRIYTKAKAEPAWRFWGLYVHVTKMDTLREAYRLAKANNGAPGIDGVTFELIERSGTEAYLQGIRDELVAGTYAPMRNRIREIPKDGSRKARSLSIPSIRDRVVQGALKLILEPIFEADFQPGSFGYRPKRTAHQAVHRVAEAIARGKTKVIDLDLSAYFDNVRHHLLLEKVARRVKDDKVLKLLKMMLKATGKKGVPQGGVISPLMSNIYLNEVDRMLERAKDTTRHGGREYVEYARYADDIVILVNPEHPRGEWLLKAVEQRLR